MMLSMRRIALCSDEYLNLHDEVVQWLKTKGMQVELFGAFKSRKDEHWVLATREASEAVFGGTCDEGIFFCWSGTGASIVANRFKGLRAALCTDAETANLARIWNHANVLVMPNRILTSQLIDEILTAWFAPYDKQKGAEYLKSL